MLKGFCNLCDVTRGTDTSVRLKSAPLISCWPLRPDCVAAVAVITDVAPAPLADGVELRGRIVANAVWQVRNCKMAISTVVSENGARAEFEGGVKQQAGPVHVVQHSHVCQYPAQSALISLGEHQKWEPKPNDEEG